MLSPVVCDGPPSNEFGASDASSSTFASIGANPAQLPPKFNKSTTEVEETDISHFHDIVCARTK